MNESESSQREGSDPESVGVNGRDTGRPKANAPTQARQDTTEQEQLLDAPTMPVSTGSLVGAKLAGYQIMRRLGRGGMADVFAGRDLNLDRDVAVKVLRKDLARDRDYISRFRREAKAAAKLNHTNIVQIYEVGQESSHHYIAQELVDGKNLREWLERNGMLDAEQAVVVLHGVAAALDAAASEGITHRDIKPENVMWSKSGVIKVADFGLARLGDGEGSRTDLTQAGLTLGTPRYMSPEQVQGHPVDPRSDLYSLGVMMYHLLAGRPPFVADDPLALAFSHVNEFPEPIDRVRGNDDIPEWLIAIVSKLMRKAPGERFQSPAELLDTLNGDDADQGRRHLVGAATATARLQRAADEQKRQRFKNRVRAVFATLIPVLCVVVGAAAVARMRPSTVDKLLRPDEVEQMQTVEAQFLHAVQRNDPAAWEAVADFFPAAESAKNQRYASESLLQLARYFEPKTPNRALDVLRQLEDDPNVARKFKLVGRAWEIRVLQALSQPTANAKRKFESLYDDLQQTNPDAIAWFGRVVSPAEQVALGLSTDKS